MCVVQIINYTSSLWGFKKFEVIDNIQNRFLMIPVLKNPKLSGFLGGFFRQRGMAYLVFDNAKWGFKKFQAKSRDRDAGIKVRCLNIIRFWNRVFHLTRTSLLYQTWFFFLPNLYSTLIITSAY